MRRDLSTRTKMSLASTWTVER